MPCFVAIRSFLVSCLSQLSIAAKQLQGVVEWSIGPQKSPRVLAPTRVNPLFSGRAYASATLVSRNASSNLGRGKIGKFFSSEFFLVSIVRGKGECSPHGVDSGSRSGSRSRMAGRYKSRGNGVGGHRVKGKSSRRAACKSRGAAGHCARGRSHISLEGGGMLWNGL